MIFIFADDSTLRVVAEADDVQPWCEPIDVENDVYAFYDEDGHPLQPVFTLPNRTRRVLGIVTLVEQGAYTLRASEVGGGSILLELAGTTALEPNHWFASLAEVRAHLLARRAGGEVDGLLGSLQPERGGWRGSFAWRDRVLSIRLGRGRGVRLARMLDLLRIELAGLDASAERAIRFASSTCPGLPGGLTLEEVEVSILHDDWLRARALPSEPMTTLVFAIPGDSNVLDVVFHRGEPVAVEYH